MIYKIIKFNLIGATFFTQEECPYIEARIVDKREKFFEAGTNREAHKSNLWEYSTTPKEGAFSSEEKFLPYFADVTEDLPGHFKFEPTTYKNCQLMVEKHGGYLQFWHEPTKQVLRIAMNSHYYTPVNDKKGAKI